MKKNESIEIKSVANGFMVCRGYEPNVGFVIMADTHVFQSMTELISFITEHFEFRCNVLDSDCGLNK